MFISVSWGTDLEIVDTTRIPENAGDTEVDPFNRDSGLVEVHTVKDTIQVPSDTVAVKVDSDSIHVETDSVKAAVSSDSVGGVAAFDTTTRPHFPPVDQTVVQKKVKNRRDTETWEYHGMSRDADRCAQQVVLDAYRGDWNEVKRELDRLERLEKKHDLVKISWLLNVSVRTYRLEQDEFLTNVEKQVIERELDSCIQHGLVYAQKYKDSCHSLRELIYCGIKGFQLSRLIEKSPVEAAIQGYAVIVRLEKLLQADSTMYDACMGLGLFYCSVASASPVIRAALTLTGKHVTLEKGLAYLRTSAQKGHYVNIPSLVYLTQFLSPYLGHHAVEKDSIFMVLQRKCESNPRYLFEQIDENICFHPEKFTRQYTVNLRKKIAAYKTIQPQLQRYNELIKYQYCKYIDTTSCNFKIDADVDLKAFDFYPAFLDGLRHKEVCMINSLGSLSRLHLKDCEKNTAEVLKKLEASSMASTKKEVYRWHILDALKLR
ncbi:MAG TPA: hypothetical protein VHO70_13735 [Chitinispirillaceae bacterium]|nr:hypothetical protein [Chitinispirillaceae bacterium]